MSNFLKFLLILLSTSNLALPVKSAQVDWGIVANKASVFSVKASNDIMYTLKRIDVKMMPSNVSKSAGVLRQHEEVKVIGYVNIDDWVQIDYDGIAYVKSKYLTVTQPDIYIIDGFYIEKGVSRKFIKKVKKSWKKLPVYVRQLFDSDGSFVFITARNLSEVVHDDVSSVIALTSFNNSVGNAIIYVSESNNYEHALLHEAGHYVDGKLKDICKRKRFKSAWKSERISLHGIDYTSTSNTETLHEYFAEAMYVYITDKASLKKACPETYKFIKLCLRRLKNL